MKFDPIVDNQLKKQMEDNTAIIDIFSKTAQLVLKGNCVDYGTKAGG